jgi:hypothetical protein
MILGMWIWIGRLEDLLVGRGVSGKVAYLVFSVEMLELELEGFGLWGLVGLSRMLNVLGEEEKS